MNRVPILRKNSEQLIEISDFEIVKHLRKVIQVEAGSSLKICLINEGLAEGIVIDVSKDKIQVEIQKITDSLEPKTKLIVGLSRPLTMQKVLEHGTTLGVSEFHFFKAELSEKSFLESKFIKDAKFESYMEKGLAQAGVFSKMPSVNVYDKFADIPLEKFASHNKLFLSLNASEFINKNNTIKKLPNVFLIGPERGFTEEEEEIFQQMDFTGIKIGPSIQRVEYATASILAQLEYFQNS